MNNGGMEYALTQLLIALALLLSGPGAYSLASRLPALHTDGEFSPRTTGLMAPRAEKKLTDLVWERRATPAFNCAPVREEDLNWILRAGVEAPSSYNLQPWRFVVVRDSEQRKRLRAAAMNQGQVEQAPVVIVACGDTTGWKEDVEEVIRIGQEHGYVAETWADRKRRNVTTDLGSHPDISMWVTKQTMIAATTMMWMAEALGYDTGPMEGFYEDKVREVLGIPEHIRVLFLLAIGRRQDKDGRYPGRLPASRTVFAERYGQWSELPTLAELRRNGR